MKALIYGKGDGGLMGTEVEVQWLDVWYDVRPQTEKSKNKNHEVWENRKYTLCEWKLASTMSIKACTGPN